MNKKAQEQIITTVLIILLVLAAVVIVWQVVQGTVRGGAREVEKQSECIGLTIEITNINLADQNITIRPSKNINAYRVFVNGAIEVNEGPSVDAYTPEIVTVNIAEGNDLEVIGKIREEWCPIGAKKKVEAAAA